MKRFISILFALVLVLSFSLLPAVPAAAIPSTIEVSQPVQLTSNSYYERGESITYDGTNYWLFYGRSAGCTDTYATGNPDVNDYQVYYKRAGSVSGLPGASATLISGAGVTQNANGYLGETGTAYFGSDVWAFATIDVAASADLYGWWTSDGGTTWNEVGPIISGLSSGQAHHDEIVFDGEVWILEGSGDFNTRHSSTPKNTGSFSTPLSVGSANGGLAHFFVDGSDLYIAMWSGSPSPKNYIYKYDDINIEWDLVDDTTPSGYYDPTLFKVGSNYVFAQAPCPAPWDRQWIVGWTSTSLNSNFFDGSELSITEGRYGSNVWVDMWPIGFTDAAGDSYLFFTSERNPSDVTAEIAGNIWYLKYDWDVTRDHYTYIQEAIDAATHTTINVAAGEYDAFHIVEKADLSIIGEDGVVILTGEVPPGEDEGACMAWVVGSTGIIIEWLEFDGTGIEDDRVGGVVYIGSTGSITGVTVSHIHGISVGLGIVVSDEGAVVTIEGCNVNDVVGGIFSAGVAVSDAAVASMEDCNIHNCWMEESPGVFGGIGVLVNMDPEMAPATLMMTGCGIFDNNFGIFVNTRGDLTANFNNITGNDVWGIYAVEDAVNVDATHNWWGHASGPTHADNPGGSGDAVSDNVDYNPWAGAAIEEAKSETISGSGTMTNSLTGGDITIDATGDHTITTAKYESNPGGTPTFQSSGNYYDVHLSDDTGVNSLTINFCPATDGMVIYYWNGTSWVAASNQAFAGGCITVTITATTTPSLADLTGSVFGGGAPLAGGVVVFLPAISNLTITPTGVRIGEAATITAEVKNKGDDSGSYTVTLKINEVIEEKKTVALAAHEKKTVTFTVIKDEAGTYQVEVNGLKGEFIVSESLPPASATFEVTDLSISPAIVKVGETVTISVSVTETSGGSGNDNVTLKINGIVVEKQEVALGSQQSQTVTFTIADQEAGSYKVEVNGLAGEFTVEEPAPEASSPPASAPPAKPINWWLIGGIIAAVVVGSFTFILVRRRAY